MALGMLFLTACLAQPPQRVPGIVSVFATSAAYPWLSDAFACAPETTALAVADPNSADVSLRLGEPESITTPAFQIGREDILVVIHPQIGFSALTLGQVRRIFAGEVANWNEVGGTDLAVQVWAFSPAEDVQVIVDRVVLQGRPVASGARLAVSAQAMSDSVGLYPGSIGVLPRRWKAGNTREALTLASVPVLAIARSEPQGDLREILSCLQSAR
jgi:ABC-type phosphate transport system substrate-binding protein